MRNDHQIEKITLFSKSTLMKAMREAVYALIITALIGGLLKSTFASVEKGKDLRKERAPQEKKIQIKSDQLPGRVKKTIQGKYKGWAVARVYEITRHKDKVYEIELLMNKEIQVIKLDRAGNVRGDG